MLDCVDFGPDDRVLDLGCGYGVVGILAARLIGAERVVMSDIDPVAVELAQRNTRQNGVADVAMRLSNAFRALDEIGFTKILCNPPYHVDFAVPKEFIHKGFNRLEIGGEMILVVRRRTWYQNKLRSIFGGASVREIDGYCVLTAQKLRSSYANP
jgi:16S rRNA (guanine1207-N2)-methyltransferase